MYLFILSLILKVVGHRCTGIFSVSLIRWTHSLGLNIYYSEFLWKLLIRTNFSTQPISEHMIKLSCRRLMIQKFSDVFHFTPSVFCINKSNSLPTELPYVPFVCPSLLWHLTHCFYFFLIPSSTPIFPSLIWFYLLFWSTPPTPHLTLF